jgi:hypothetical protein
MQKESKKAVSYTAHAVRHDERCALCRYFTGMNTCERVEGLIVPSGWCELFKRKASTT